MENWSKEQLCALAEKYGTPLYVYNTAIMKKQLEKIRTAFSFDHEIYFSCKSTSNPVLFRFFQSLNCGLDTVSINQVKIGLDSGFEPQKILYTPNGSSYDSIENAHHLGVQINFDNLEHLERFVQKHKNASIFLRFNPGIIAGGSANVSVGHIESKFGIHLSQIPHLLKILKTYEVKIKGIHVHAGSDIIDTQQFVHYENELFKLAQHFSHLEKINIGSGFKVAYKNNDVATDLELLGEELEKSIKKISARQQKQLSIIVEPGKFLLSDAGVFLVSVNLVKQTPSATFVFVNSGFNHFIRPMYYNAYHYIENISSQSEQTKIYNIVGYLGETDTFGWNRALRKVNEGDVLVVKNAGAYGYSMSSNYNSRGRPAEILLHNDEAHLISRKEELEDMLHLTQTDSVRFL